MRLRHTEELQEAAGRDTPADAAADSTEAEADAMAPPEARATSTPLIPIICDTSTPMGMGMGVAISKQLAEVDASLLTYSPLPTAHRTTPNDSMLRSELQSIEDKTGGGNADEIQNKYKDALLNITQLQQHKVATNFELEQFKDRHEDLQEELAETQAELRRVKHELRAHARGEPATEADQAKVAPPAEAAADSARLKKLEADNAALAAQLEEQARELGAAKSALALAEASKSTVAMQEQSGDENISAAKIQRLESQLKRAATQKEEAERAEDEARSGARKAAREGRQKDNKISDLETQLATIQGAYDRLRGRKTRLGLGAQDDAEA